MIKNGKLFGRMKPQNVESLQMLTGNYTSGMIDIPCQNSSKELQEGRSCGGPRTSKVNCSLKSLNEQTH